ncbi:Protein kinase superfamily protein [Arabidopsis thaliana]|uniref:Protein kinase superfamily protein n=1 Tax=Arabidopsis thaliana TaxID=3702 RepID=Q3E900_ARATH|nr:Protein kinase superfamily protein [Arabidopsis thaliana]AED93725.1 Protein kinase superfamily protein [Arabidopsis thaliana]|eukprot:NP_198131.1 Protein kinase superfamily protein [Arabidopsis thaliana]
MNEVAIKRINRSICNGGVGFGVRKVFGKGSFGSVRLFSYKRRCDGETLYATVKTSDDAKSLYEEFQILSKFKGCPRIVQCYGNGVKQRFNDKGYVEYMIPMEYATGGSLNNFMDRFNDRKLPDPMIRKFTRMLLEGLATIHRYGYVHYDIKPENILVFPGSVYKEGAWRYSYKLKISDFGLSKRDGDTKWWHPLKSYAGTRIYMSPESISHGEIGKGLDLWSLGCVVLEMYTGKRPWWHTNYELEDLMKCYEPLFPPNLPCDAKLFLMTCFAPEPDERKDALTLLRQSFFRRDVNKLTKLLKVDNRNDFTLELKKLRQMLSEIRSMR